MDIRHFIITLFVGYCFANTDNSVENFELYTQQPSQKFKNLILEGGGAKAISYIGALKAFKNSGYYHDKRYTFENISGTSSGCLMGLFISLDIEPDKLETEVFANDIFSSISTFNLNLLTVTDEMIIDKELDEMQKSWFSAFKNTYKLIVKVSKLLQLWSINKSPGLSTDQKYQKFITTVIFPMSPYKNLLEANMTFDDLYRLTGHRLTCYASRLKENTIVEFNAQSTPKEYVLKGVYASISIPGIFKPVTDNYGYPLVDGGVLNNFPIYDYDLNGIPSQETLGLSLNNGNHDMHDRKALSAPTVQFQFSQISTYDYVLMLYSLINDEDIPLYILDSRNKNRIVYLDSPLQVLSTNIKSSILSLAINRAYFNTLVFLNNRRQNAFEDPTNFINFDD